LIDSIWDAI